MAWLRKIRAALAQLVKSVIAVPPANKGNVSVRGDVKDSHIITGDINISLQTDTPRAEAEFLAAAISVASSRLLKLRRADAATINVKRYRFTEDGRRRLRAAEG